MIIKLDLCEAKLSRIKTNFLSGYFIFILSNNSEKYSSKTSLVVPPSVKNRNNSTPLSDIVAVHVRFWINLGVVYKTAGSPIGE